MRFCSGFASGIRPLRRVAFAALLSFAISLFPAGTSAQQPAAAPDQTQPPRPVTFQKLFPPDQLTFLGGYAGKPAKDLLKNKQFRGMLKAVFPIKEYHYSYDRPMMDAVEFVINDGSKAPVEIHDGRYVWVMGHISSRIDGRTLLWIDMQTGAFLGTFYFHPVNGEPTPTLTVFSRQIDQEDLSMSQLPLAFAEDLSQWTAVSNIPPVTTRYFIPDNGKKYVLLHDEDYCDHPPNAPAPPQNVCMQMNANAADADMNAAYFMKQSHNAANAVAWYLSADQTAWLGMRIRTCGAAVACSVRVTRERTSALVGSGPRR